MWKYKSIIQRLHKSKGKVGGSKELEWIKSAPSYSLTRWIDIKAYREQKITMNKS